jgi:phospholipid transport system transporter-binding protein
LTQRALDTMAGVHLGSPTGAALVDDPSSYDECFALRGPVTLANLQDVRRQGEAALAAAGTRASIDLSGLTQGNSAALAVLMAWFRRAQSLGKSVIFTGAPVELQKIMELSGMSRVLPVVAGSSDGEVQQ